MEAGPPLNTTVRTQTGRSFVANVGIHVRKNKEFAYPAPQGPSVRWLPGDNC